MKHDQLEALIVMAVEADTIEREAMGLGPEASALESHTQAELKLVGELEAQAARPSAWTRRVLIASSLAAAACLSIAGVSIWNGMLSAQGVVSGLHDVAVNDGPITIGGPKVARGVGGGSDASKARPAGPEIANADNEKGSVCVAAGAGQSGDSLAVNTPVLSGEVKSDVAARIMPASFGGRAIASHAHDECSVVLLIVRDFHGISSCVQIKPHDFGERCVQDLTSYEMAYQAQGEQCMPGHQMLVVALSGPSESLPTNDRSARALAACILGLPRTCDAEGACFDGPTASCVAKNVSFKVETVALK